MARLGVWLPVVVLRSAIRGARWPRFAFSLCVVLTASLELALPGVGDAASPPVAASRADGAALFAAVSPAIAFIMTDDAAGSGILFDEGYVLTNAHVVSPYDHARVRFPNATEIIDTPVVGWDLLADLAVLRVGPIPGVQPVRVGDWRDLPVGSDVYLLGYPGETERRPTPTVARGLVSKRRPGRPELHRD